MNARIIKPRKKVRFYLYSVTCTHVINNKKSAEIEMKYSIVQARSTYYSDNSHIYFKTHFVWTIRPHTQKRRATKSLQRRNLWKEKQSERRTCARILILPDVRKLCLLQRMEQPKKTPKVPPFKKRGMEVGSPNRNSRRQINLMVSSRTCSLKLNTTRSLFWIDQPHSWKKVLLLRKG